jgi:hypothetical protein
VLFTSGPQASAKTHFKVLVFGSSQVLNALNLKASGALLVITAMTLFALTPAVSAQATLPFSSSLNTTKGTLTISNTFYYVGFDLSHGARAYFWWVNASRPALLSMIPFNTTSIPTPLHVNISA